jgi:hypothetical protein
MQIANAEMPWQKGPVVQNSRSYPKLNVGCERVEISLFFFRLQPINNALIHFYPIPHRHLAAGSPAHIPASWWLIWLSIARAWHRSPQEKLPGSFQMCLEWGSIEES